MSVTDPPAPICPLCHVALKMRLGELECPECGFIPPAAQILGRESPSGYPGARLAPAADRLSFFAPARYIPPDTDAGSGSLYFEKRLCFRIFVVFQLLPIFGLLAFAVFFSLMTLGMLKDSADMFTGMRSMFWLVWGIIALGIVLWGIQAAIEILLFRWALFSAYALPKWGCLAWTGLSMLYSAYASFVMSFSGQVDGQPAAPLAGWLRGLAVGVIVLVAFFQAWIVFILQRDVMQQ